MDLSVGPELDSLPLEEEEDGNLKHCHSGFPASQCKINLSVTEERTGISILSVTCSLEYKGARG